MTNEQILDRRATMYEDEMLDIIAHSDEITNSDLQGVVSAFVSKLLKPICPDHADGHQFVQCDEWGATCSCGKPENER